MMLLEVKDLSVKYGSRTIVKDIGFSLAEGDWLMIVGPNGAGKSTIVNAVSGGVPYEGTVRYEGKELRTYRPAALARRIGVLTQNHYVGYSFTVEEVVRLGRYAYTKGVFSGRDADCETKIERALSRTGLSELAGRSVLSLAGGELQRVFLAQLFAQDPAVLILDEPMNHLDLKYQKQLLELVSDWLKQPGRAVLSVVHDLSLARAYGTEVLLLREGDAVARGNADTVFTRENMERVYGMDVHRWMNDLLELWSSDK